MALLVCPDCGGNVSSKAAKCPRCGCPVSVMIQEQPNSEKQQNTEQQSVEQSIQEQPQQVEIVNNEEKNIEEQPKVSVQKEEKVAEPSIRQKSAKEKTNNIIVAVAIIILFGIIIVAGKMSGNNERESSSVPSDNNSDITNTETTIPIDSPNIAKIQNSAEATQRLNDFKRKITSSPFEKGAVEIVKVIDNDYAKCIFFLGNILQHYVFTKSESESHDIGSLFAYNAVSNILYEFKDKAFNKVDITKLQHDKAVKKYEIASDDYDMLEYGFELAVMGYIHSYYSNQGYDMDMFRKTSKGYYSFFEKEFLNITDYSNKGCVIIQSWENNQSIICRVTVDEFKITNQGVFGIIYDDKFIVIGCTEYYNVVDLSSGEKIDNPFWKSGPVSLYGADGVKFVGNVSPQGGVKGELTYQGHTFDVTNGSVDDKDVLRLLVSKFLIQKKNNRFFLYEMDDGYDYDFFGHSLDKTKPSDIKKTTELFMK